MSKVTTVTTTKVFSRHLILTFEKQNQSAHRVLNVQQAVARECSGLQSRQKQQSGQDKSEEVMNLEGYFQTEHSQQHDQQVWVMNLCIERVKSRTTPTVLTESDVGMVLSPSRT